jgi:hypothetical protein
MFRKIHFMNRAYEKYFKYPTLFVNMMLSPSCPTKKAEEKYKG